MLFKNMKLGFKLWKTGRLSLKTEKTGKKGDLKKLLSDIDKQREEVTI
jgi:hypothetical protein